MKYLVPFISDDTAFINGPSHGYLSYSVMQNMIDKICSMYKVFYKICSYGKSRLRSFWYAAMQKLGQSKQLCRTKLAKYAIMQKCLEVFH